jgi:hypothetical protein
MMIQKIEAQAAEQEKLLADLKQDLEPKLSRTAQYARNRTRIRALLGNLERKLVERRELIGKLKVSIAAIEERETP